MFIKVEKDIVDVILHQQKGKERERAIEVMVQLMSASRMNNHKVYLKCLLGDNEKSALKGALDENSWREFCKLQRERLDVDGLLQMLDIYAVITKSKHCSRVGKVLLVNPFESDDFLFNIATYLCTENQRDGLFYRIVVNKYISSRRLSNMETCFRKWQGGGSDFGNTLKNDDILKTNFVFAIADSDKSYPNDKDGKTAKSIKFLGHNRFNADYYILSKVAEIENLAPIKLVKKHHPDIKNIENSDLSYFDFKEGLKYTILYDSRCRTYWESNFSEISIKWEEIANLTKGKSRSDYNDIVHGKPPLIKGCGRKLLDSLLEDGDWDSIRREDFSEAQITEWNCVGRKVFSWTCCSKKRL